MNNPELQRAWQIIENTGTHLFLTGKAGTGKTTFLHNLAQISYMRPLRKGGTAEDFFFRIFRNLFAGSDTLLLHM